MPSSRPDRAPVGRVGSERAAIPEATVARLPIYLRALTSLAEAGLHTVSSEELASAAGVGPAKLRKDLSQLGSYGTRGVGYEVNYLIYQISRQLGLTQSWGILIVGAGNLGRALANYGGFASRGFTVAGIIDADNDLVGRELAGHVVAPIESLEATVEASGAHIAVLALPAEQAQNVCDRLVGAGITSIMNFAPCVIDVPPHVMVRKVDLSTELQILAFHQQRRSSEDASADVPRVAGAL